MRRLLVFAPLLIFGLAGIYLLSSFLRDAAEGAFQDNLLPELIGFCLEGFFLVGLFSLIQRRLERDRKQELRQSLRGALRDVLSHLDVALLEQNAEPASSQALEHDPQVVATLFKKLNTVELDLHNMARLKSCADHSYGVTRDLIPVAAQLSPEHMRWWLAITESVRHLSEAADRASVQFAAHKFLINLGEFDQLQL
ncbi:hypothetical protein E2F43_07235 [Seongchinamella unica]|uniref:Uncharacterized protein n=1 Tax=Seongchinamella unica TaxID=2547392 RepID=A0A4R5LR46_9GAMM|nr:hypothetical protein [Seongchinamella unica]TDG13329.1 hypothetical protein E2F43_07235 [Seongchinamella unica]